MISSSKRSSPERIDRLLGAYQRQAIALAEVSRRWRRPVFHALRPRDTSRPDFVKTQNEPGYYLLQT